MPAALKNSLFSGNSRRLLACGFLLLALGVSVRLWHDRSAVMPAGANTELPNHGAAHASGELDAQIALGADLHKSGRLDDARRIFESVDRSDPHDPRAVVWLGMIAVQRHEVARGIAYFEEALRRDPADADVCRSLGELYERQGATARSVALYERAAQLHSKDAANWRMLGLADLRIGRLSRGREALRQAAQLAPDDLKTQAALGDVNLRLGLLEEARQSYSAVLAHTPDEPSALAASAQINVQLEPTPDGLQKAENQVNRAISLRLTPQCLLVRGHISLLRHNYDAAIRDLDRAVKMDPNLAEAYGFLSQAYAAIGKPDQARQESMAFERARERVKQASSRTQP